MVKVKVSLHFNGSGYIGKPFWPELDTLINISKDVHPKLAEQKKQAAIAAACEKRGIEYPAGYNRLQELAARPFYTVDGTANGEVVIPERVLQSFINHASMASPKAIPRVSQKGLTFLGVKIQGGFLRTGKSRKDAKRFERFVKLEESNQRSFSSSEYLDDFTASGVLAIDEEIIKQGDLRKLMEYGGKWFGIGGARPQGFGRFQVTEWETL